MVARGPRVPELSIPVLDPCSFMGPFYHLQTPPWKGGGAESFAHPHVDCPYGAGLAWHLVGQVSSQGSPCWGQKHRRLLWSCSLQTFSFSHASSLLQPWKIPEKVSRDISQRELLNTSLRKSPPPPFPLLLVSAFGLVIAMTSSLQPRTPRSWCSRQGQPGVHPAGSLPKEVTSDLI